MPVVTGYSRTQIRLHWAVVVLVTLQYLFHDGIADAFEDGLDAGALTLTGPAAAHMAGGGLVLALVVWRLALRRARGAPPPPAAEPGWAKPLARATHWAFYAVLILLPVSGAAAWATASEAAGEVHEALRLVLLLLIAAHVGAVLVHQFVWRTDLMARMRRPGE